MGRMTVGLLFALVGTCCAIPARADQVTASKLESVVTMRLEGWITIGKSGEVLDYRIDDDMTPAVSKLVEKSVRQWRFWPIEIDGNPVVARTRMLLTVQGTPVGAGYSLKIDNTRFGERLDSATEDGSNTTATAAASSQPALTPRRHPIPVAPRSNLRGSVRVYIHVAPDGHVDHADAVQAALFNAKGEPALIAEALNGMIDSAVSAIRQWTYAVRTPDGKPFPGMTASIQVLYQTQYTSRNDPVTGARRLGRTKPDMSLFTETGSWRSEIRSPWQRPAWYHPQPLDQRIGVSDAGGDGASPVGLSSPFRVREDGAERTL